MSKGVKRVLTHSSLGDGPQPGSRDTMLKIKTGPASAAPGGRVFLLLLLLPRPTGETQGRACARVCMYALYVCVLACECVRVCMCVYA